MRKISYESWDLGGQHWRRNCIFAHCRKEKVDLGFSFSFYLIYLFSLPCQVRLLKHLKKKKKKIKKLFGEMITTEKHSVVWLGLVVFALCGSLLHTQAAHNHAACSKQAARSVWTSLTWTQSGELKVAIINMLLMSVHREEIASWFTRKGALIQVKYPSWSICRADAYLKWSIWAGSLIFFFSSPPLFMFVCLALIVK